MAVDRKQQMKEITERLEQGVKDIFTSEMYTTYLHTMAKFHNYSFNDEFLDAVKEYLSEKWNMPNKDDVVSEIIEKAAPVPDNSAQDYSDVPVYYEPFSYAKENDEVDKVQRENINSINYFRDDKLVQQAISDMEKLMEARQKSKEQERSSTKKSVLDALRSLKTKKQEQPAQEQDKPKKAKKKGMEL